MNKFEELREKYPVFNYDGYKINKNKDTIDIEYNFSIDNLDSFKTNWTIPYKEKNTKMLLGANTIEKEEQILNKLVFSLGLVEAISYYKLTCAKEVNVKCGTLTNSQAKFFKKLFYKGLGEFMFINNINISLDDFFKLNYEETNEKPISDPGSYKNALVPVGGGKDSCVTLEMIQNNSYVTTFAINPNETIKNVIKASEITRNINVDRKLDPKIIEYNAKGFLNGHTPFSAMVAFSSFLTAYLNSIKYITLSNESSANESTVKDSFINHQYSKSLEFENDFIEYIKTVTDSDIHYFSYLRMMNEIEIAKFFSQNSKYFKVFRSCNKGSKKGIWCCDCAKCLFVYIILSPFIKEETLIEIFGKKVLDNPNLEEDFKGLIGVNENKPFECVGTREEVAAALKVYISNHSSLLTDKYKDYILSLKGRSLEELAVEETNNHNVPDKFKVIRVV